MFWIPTICSCQKHTMCLERATWLCWNMTKH
jgi:hypothetical protein